MTTTHLLLDIEGTTCPISFVSKVLFPYAQQALPGFLQANAQDAAVNTVVKEAWEEWRNDKDEDARALLEQAKPQHEDHHHQAIKTYLLHLISIDRKSTALKDLQGKIWEEGYGNGAIKTDLFPETLQAFQEWKTTGLELAVYSSGSVSAQRLLYQYTNEGDKRDLFCDWFDTRTGPKKESASYTTIAKRLNISPCQITFISDSRHECDAANTAGLNTLFSLRAENPDQNPGPHQTITSLTQVLKHLNHQGRSA